MNTVEYLKKVAYIGEMDGGFANQKSEVYLSKFDNSYITHVGMEDNVKFLAEREITKELTHGVGLSQKDGKWYGWSHRAIFGFKIGSECKKGDCHYVGSSLGEQEEAAVRFWEDEHHINVRCVGIVERDGGKWFDIKWGYTNTTHNEKLKNQIGGVEHFITPLGNGEWVAKTTECAKQMAKDFNEGVS